jgi:hypothetical protein
MSQVQIGRAGHVPLAKLHFSSSGAKQYLIPQLDCCPGTPEPGASFARQEIPS